MSELKPCPFCGKEPEQVRRKHNPYARCITEDCMASKLPMISLDLPEDIERWNKRHTPDGWQCVPKQADEKMIVELMCTGLRHAEYVTGREPTVSEMQQGYQFMLSAAPKPGDA